MARWATLLIVAVLLLATLAVAGVGYWFSGLGDRRAMVEDYLSKRLEVPVSIGTIVPGWRGIAPQVRAMDVTIGSTLEGPPALSLEELDLTVEPLSLLAGDPVIRELALLGARLELERMRDGRVRLAQVDRTGNGAAGGWQTWLRHRELRIERGTLVWQDHLAQEAPLVFSDVEVTARRRGTDLSVSASVRPPVSLAGRVSLEADLSGIGSRDGKRDAHVAVSAPSVDLVQLPAVVSELLPLSAGGFADLQGWLQWKDSRLSSGFASLDVSQPSALLQSPLPVLAAARHLRVEASWQRSGTGWSLELDPVRVRPWGGPFRGGGEPLIDGPVGITRADGSTRITVPGLALEGVNRLLAAEGAEGIAARLQALEPTGRLHDLTLDLGHGDAGLQVTSFEAGIRDGGIAPGPRTPGFSGLDAHVSGAPAGGRLQLDSDSVRLDYPRVFRDVLEITRLAGEVGWQRVPGEDTGLRITGSGLEIGTPHAGASVELRVELPGARGGAPFVHASGEIHDGDGGYASRYLPAGIMPAKAVQWLDRAIVAGTVPSGSFVYSGRTDRFPFRDGDGRFRVSFQVRDGVLDYEPGWPRLEGADGVLTFERASMRATGFTGEVAGLTLDSGRASIADLKIPQPVLELEGSLSGGFGPVIEFLRTGPISGDIGLDTVAVTGSGRGSTELALTVPLKAAHTTAVDGRYHFEEAALRFSSGIVIDGLRGVLDYSRDELAATGIEGRMLGGPVSIDVVTEKPGPSPVVALVARGHARSAELEPVLGERLTAELSGDADWSGRMRIERGAAHLQVESTLEGVAVSLPAPVGKPADTSAALRVDVRYGGAMPAGIGGEGRRQVTSFQVGRGLNGVLSFVDRDGWKPLRGQIVLGGGEAQLPAGEGVVIHVVLPGLELDPWLAFLEQQGDGDGGDGLQVRRIDASIDALSWLGRSFDEVQAVLTRSRQGEWTGTLEGPEAEGSFQLLGSPGARRITADLARLHWPAAAPDGGEGGAEAPDDGRSPASLPTLEVRAKEFRYGDMRLGELTLQGAPRAGDWALQTLVLNRPDLVVTGTGGWSGEPGETRSRVDLEAESSNLGSALAALDIHQVEGGRATAAASLSWEGGFGALGWGRLEGSYELSASDGRFIKVEPGVGRVFGLFNTETLTRRLRLDFSDLYSKGFSFDRIDSQGTIGDGQLRLVQHYISGPAALIEMQGLVGLVGRDYDLVMTVVPEVGDNLSLLGGVLGGPAAGALIFLAQKVFEEQLADMVHYRYRISGSWEEPVVARVGTAAGEQRPERIGDRVSPELMTRPGGSDGGS